MIVSSQVLINAFFLRALVAEALEMSFFMARCASSDEETSKELQELDMKDWAWYSVYSLVSSFKDISVYGLKQCNS